MRLIIVGSTTVQEATDICMHDYNIEMEQSNNDQNRYQTLKFCESTNYFSPFNMQLQTFIASLLSLLTLSFSLPHAVPNSLENPVDVVSNSLSPLSANSAGNSNSNTGLLDGNNIEAREDPTDVVSNSLSPLSANAAGNDNKNTGLLNGNSVEVDPTVDPTVNLA